MNERGKASIHIYIHICARYPDADRHGKVRLLLSAARSNNRGEEPVRPRVYIRWYS